MTVGRNDRAGGHCEDGWRASWDRAFAVAAPAWTYLTRISRFVQVRELRRSIDEHLRSEGVYDRIRDFVKQHASEHGVRRHESSKLFFFLTVFACAQDPKNADEVISALQERGMIDEVLASLERCNGAHPRANRLDRT